MSTTHKQRPDDHRTRNITLGMLLTLGVGTAVAAVIMSGSARFATVDSRGAIVSPSETVAALSDEELFEAEEAFRREHQIGVILAPEPTPAETRSPALSDEDLFQAEQEFRRTHGIDEVRVRTRATTDEELMLAEEDFRRAHGIAH